jgi:hypothetical protein
MEKTNALRFVNVNFLKKPALYALKTLNLKLTLPSLEQEAPHRMVKRLPRVAGKVLAAVGQGNS